MGGSAATPTADAIRTILKSQYHAALAMLREAVERCPDALWDDPRHGARCWQVAYHALFFAHFYGGRDEASFRPWKGHQGDVQYPDGIAGDPDPKSPLPLVARPYTKAEVLEFWAFCDGGVDAAVDALELDRADCGFDWYKVPKLEHAFVNIRHIQHHTAQLATRLRQDAGIGIDWVGARRPKAEARG